MKTYTIKEIMRNVEGANDLVGEKRFSVSLEISIETFQRGKFETHKEGEFYTYEELMNFLKENWKGYIYNLVDSGIFARYGMCDLYCARKQINARWFEVNLIRKERRI